MDNKTVLCAQCRRDQPDLGVRQTCSYCGTFPLPSYSYRANSSFHPNNCNGVKKAPRLNPNVVRRTPVPTLKL